MMLAFTASLFLRAARDEARSWPTSLPRSARPDSSAMMSQGLGR